MADRAAVLTVLQAAVEDSATIKKLAAALRVSTPFVGKSCRREVEWAELLGSPAQVNPPYTLGKLIQDLNLQEVDARQAAKQQFRVAGLTPAHRKAWASWKLAEENHTKAPTDQVAYDWLRECSDDSFVGNLVDYDLPAFDTWKRYLRVARKAVGENKNLPRMGRSDGVRSIVKENEL